MHRWSRRIFAVAWLAPGTAFAEGSDDSASADGLMIFSVAVLGLAALVLLHKAWTWIENRSIARDQAHFDEVEQLLEAAGPRFAAVERAFWKGEDAEARAALDRAIRAAARIPKRVTRVRLARGKKRPKRMAELNATISELVDAGREAEGRLVARFGPDVLRGEAERVGCWFCARPLANPEVRVTLSVKRGAESFPAVVCPDCAAQVAAGDPPRVKVVDQDGRQVHWSEVPEFDPYLARYQPFPGATTVGLHRLAPEPGRSLGQLALLAAGGALAVGAGSALAAQAVDFDALKASAAARAAARASAGRTVDRERQDGLRDQS